STKSSPPNILSRSRMLAKPIPACAAAGSKPTPKSLTFRTIVSTVLNYIVQRFLRDTVNAECQVGWHVFRQLRDIEGYWNTLLRRDLLAKLSQNGAQTEKLNPRGMEITGKVVD